MKNLGFLKELNIGFLIKIKENSWNGRDYINLESYLTDDLDTINYRLDALADLMENRSLYEAVMEIVPQIDSFRELRSLSSAASDEIDDLYSVRDLQIYLDLVDYLHDKLNKFELRSELFLTVRKEINAICGSEEYDTIKKCLPENAKLIQSVQSVTVGVNLDPALHPVEAGIVSVNDQKYVSGSIIDKLLRADMKPGSFQCSAPLTVPAVIMSPEEKERIEYAINSGLHKILRSSLRSWKPAVKAYSNAKINFLIGYYSDLRFLIAAAEFFYRLKAKNYPICRPKAFPMEQKRCLIKQTYNPEFVLQSDHMTLNDAEFDENGMIYIFTGANGGGKTLFAKSVAVCQALFQLGLYVPAEYAELSPCSELLLHFPMRESSLTKSRFMEECDRMSSLMRIADRYSMILCDEAFSGTSAGEAAAIASEVIKAMSAKGCRGIFITHMHELSTLPDKINAFEHCVSNLDNLTVTVEEETGKRLYKIIRGSPDKTSRAGDIAKRYGLDYDSLTSQSAQ